MRIPLWAVAVMALVAGGVVFAQGAQMNPRTFNGDVTINGDIAATSITTSSFGSFNSLFSTNSVSVGTNVTAAQAIAAGLGHSSSIQFNGGDAAEVTISAQGATDTNIALTPSGTGVVTAGAANVKTTGRYCSTAACTTNYLVNDTFGTLNVVGAMGGSSNWTTAGSISTDDYLIPKAGIKNTGTAAACTSNTGAVCVNDTGGLAVGDGSGATVATISATGAAVFNGGSTIGSTGTAISALCAASATLDFASSLVTACSADLTINLACATVTSPVALQVPNVAMVAGSHFQAWVSSAGVISIRHCCLAGTSCDPASGVFAVRAIAP